jgi:hypothetical protein
VGTRKGRMVPKNFCTYCGEGKKLTTDHVIPKALFVEPSNERSITVRACLPCQEGKEGLLKTFFAFLDKRILDQRIVELKHAKARGERLQLYQTMSFNPATQQFRCYFTKPLMRALNKMFLGMRRYLMDDELRLSWSFLGPERVGIFKLDIHNNVLFARRLPLEPDAEDNAIALPLACSKDFGKCHRVFRDFHIGSPTADCSFVTIRYARRDFESLGNTFWLYAYFAPRLKV